MDERQLESGEANYVHTAISEFDLECGPQAWDDLTRRLDELIAAWCSGQSPPELAEFLPAEPPALRRLALIELIKIDLEHRWPNPQWRKTLEEYCRQFPELAIDGELPYDLIHEEFHIRRHAGEKVQVQDYVQRFPQQAAQLRQMLVLGEASITTTAIPRGRSAAIQVGSRVDDFDLLTSLGQGAFAQVYLARQNSMQRLVALKISADRGSEPQTMAQLDHPHIVRVFDQRILREQGMRLLYMQYVAGGTLQPVAERIRRLSPEERRGTLLLEEIDAALEKRGELAAESRTRQLLAHRSWPEVVCWLGARLAAALDYAHQRGVLHRDIKPANVLLASDGSPKLADFNISFSSAVEGVTAAAYFGGSLAYMSPEQLEAFHPAHPRRPDELDGRSDLYSLGVMLWELLTGRRPFVDEPLRGDVPQVVARMAQRRREGVDPAMLAQLPPDCPSGIDDILLTCLAPEPEHRFATAGQLARQLELALQPQVQRLLHPRPTDWRSRARRYAAPALVSAGLAPNVTASGLNIVYNYYGVVEQLGQAAIEVFYAQLLIVNPIFYGLGIGVLLCLTWPVLSAVRRLSLGRPLDADRLPNLRRRCLWLGDYVAWIVASLWAISGLVFPIWLHLSVGGKAAMEFREYLFHFIGSQVIYGLIAATLSFFLVNVLAVRAFYPRLVQPEIIDDELGRADLLALGNRQGWYYNLAVAVPILAICLLTMVLVTHEGLQVVFGVVATGVGLLATFLARSLSRLIERDLASLAIAASPGGAGMGEGSESLELFWTSSR